MPAPKKPTRETRAKASRPELQPLDEHLAALLNPALVETKPQGFGEAPQQKFESAAPDSHPHGLSGTPASAESLKALLGLGDPNIRNRQWPSDASDCGRCDKVGDPTFDHLSWFPGGLSPIRHNEPGFPLRNAGRRSVDCRAGWTNNQPTAEGDAQPARPIINAGPASDLDHVPAVHRRAARRLEVAGDDIIRLSIDLENADDLIRDLPGAGLVPPQGLERLPRSLLRN